MVAASGLVVGGAAAAGVPVVGLLGGADASDHPSAETNGVPPGPPTWLGEEDPYGPPSWLNETEPIGPPTWLGLPDATEDPSEP
ncbi:MAG: hypothetical protein A3K68_02140 [Euryarchaeota archaeon RBG_16_68_13]|nr:MAG: hypothetical protein A3K68_02140 [Euryarchaeota archaeon RBG_16_68_13]